MTIVDVVEGVDVTEGVDVLEGQTPASNASEGDPTIVAVSDDGVVRIEHTTGEVEELTIPLERVPEYRKLVRPENAKNRKRRR